MLTGNSGLIMVPAMMKRVIRSVLLVHLIALFTEALEAKETDLKRKLEAQGALVEALSWHFDSLVPAAGLDVRFAKLQGGLKDLKADTTAGKLVGERLAEIEREVRALSQGVDTYREEYIQWVRLTAEGESHPEVRLLNGKIYREVVIRKVTDVGLEIRHLAGSARVHELRRGRARSAPLNGAFPRE